MPFKRLVRSRLTRVLSYRSSKARTCATHLRAHSAGWNRSVVRSPMRFRQTPVMLCAIRPAGNASPQGNDRRQARPIFAQPRTV